MGSKPHFILQSKSLDISASYEFPNFRVAQNIRDTPSTTNTKNSTCKVFFVTILFIVHCFLPTYPYLSSCVF